MSRQIRRRTRFVAASVIVGSDQNDPWVFGLTTEPAGPEGWTITAVSLDSAD